MPIFVLGASIFTNIFTIITVFMFWRGECDSKNRTKKDNPKCLKYTLTVFMVLLVVTIIGYNILDFLSDESFDELRKESDKSIANAREVLTTQDYFSKLKNSSEHIPVFIAETMKNFQEMVQWQNIIKADNSYEEYYNEHQRQEPEFKDWARLYVDVRPVTTCQLQDGFDLHEVFEHVDRPKRVKSMKDAISIKIRNVSTILERINEALVKQGIEQQRMDSGKNETENRLRIIPEVYKHFQNVLNQLETTRQEWSSNTLSFFRPRTNVRLIVNITIAILIILTTLSILAVVKPKFVGPKMPIRIALIAFYTTGALSLSIGLVIMLMSFRIIGSFDCPLTKDNFGLSNFTKPFPLPTGNVLPICKNIDSTVFTGLETISCDSINKTLKMAEYKEEVMKFTNDWKIVMPNGFVEEFGYFADSENVIWRMYTRCEENKRWGYTLYNYCKALEYFINTGRWLIALVTVFNEKGQTLFSSVIDEQNNKTLLSFDKLIKDMDANYDAIDISCQPLVASFTKIMLLSTCKQFELETYLIYLAWTLVACLISLILHIIVHGNVKSSKENVENYEQSPQSPVSTTTINSKNVTPK